LQSAQPLLDQATLTHSWMQPLARLMLYITSKESKSTPDKAISNSLVALNSTA
jgi:hypothetical protein